MTVIRHLALIQARIEKIAAQDSAAGTGASLDETLARLTHAARRRVTMLLGRTRAFSEDPQERLLSMSSGGEPRGRGTARQYAS